VSRKGPSQPSTKVLSLLLFVNPSCTLTLVLDRAGEAKVLGEIKGVEQHSGKRVAEDEVSSKDLEVQEYVCAGRKVLYQIIFVSIIDDHTRPSNYNVVHINPV
jgi:hypothetical protein